MKTNVDALALVAGTLADVFAPIEFQSPSAWAVDHLIVPDGPRKLDGWDASMTPYIAEPLDMSASDSPENEICSMKSAQTGFTTLLLAAIGHTIDRDPADMMVVQPTDGALTDFNSKKLQPCLDKTDPTARLVARQTSRTGLGSTTYEKRFRGDFSLTLALASSSADLRSKTVKKVFCDEIDEYPEDLDGQGSPFDMIEARQESFLKDGTWKRFSISTPTVKGASHIERKWEASDKRRWHVRCPHCAQEFVFEFGPHFHFDREYPWSAWYSCPHCGTEITEVDRTTMIRTGRWIATAPGAGRTPGFHFDALSSPFVPWSKIAERFVKAGDDPAKLKTFWNLTLGLPFEFKGDAPDHVRLMERSRGEPHPRGSVPPRGLILVAAADVQMRGIWCEIIAIAPNRESWTVDAFYCDGSTESVEGGEADAPNAFDILKRKTLDREFPDAFGGKRTLDALAVDSGYRSHVVYAWVRKVQRLHPYTGEEIVLATKGVDGWGKPAIGTPALQDIDLAGHRVKKGVKVWPVGTWSLKGAFYADLRKDGIAAGRDLDPEGYCHFGAWLDKTYFRQLTAEYLADGGSRGRPMKVWKIRASDKDNHFLDCRVYNLALAEYLGLSRMTADDWAVLTARHGVPEDILRPDLFKSASQAAAPAPDPDPAPEPTDPAPSSPPRAGWMGALGGWMNRR